MAVNELISKLRTVLENDWRIYECVDESPYESLTSGIVSKAVAVIHDPLSGPETFVSETFSVVGSNHIVSETQCYKHWLV